MPCNTALFATMCSILCFCDTTHSPLTECQLKTGRFKNTKHAPVMRTMMCHLTMCREEPAVQQFAQAQLFTYEGTQGCLRVQGDR